MNLHYLTSVYRTGVKNSWNKFCTFHQQNIINVETLFANKKTETILSMNGTILLQSLLRDRSEKAKAITFYAQLTISKNVELNRQFFFAAAEFDFR